MAKGPPPFCFSFPQFSGKKQIQRGMDTDHPRS